MFGSFVVLFVEGCRPGRVWVYRHSLRSVHVGGGLPEANLHLKEMTRHPEFISNLPAISRLVLDAGPVWVNGPGQPLFGSHWQVRA